MDSLIIPDVFQVFENSGEFAWLSKFEGTGSGSGRNVTWKSLEVHLVTAALVMG